MVKFLTQFKKHIMAAVSVLLLVVFLAPTAVSQCSRMNAKPSTVWATADDGTKITLGDLEKIRGQMRILSNLRDLALADVNQKRQNRFGGSPAMTWLMLAAPKEPEHWWLLAREAKAGGLVGGQGDGRMFLTAVATVLGATPDQLLAVLMGQSGQSQVVVLDTLAELAGVERMMSLVAGAPRAGEARLKMAARELLTTVSCDVVPISAAGAGDAVPVPPPTLEELEKQFKLARESRAGTGPGGAGYMFEDRVTVEWLTVPLADVVRSLANDPAMGPVELRKEFLKNPLAYAAPTAPGVAPVAPAFEDVKDRVRTTVRDRLAKDRMDRVSTFARDWARASVKDLPVTGGIVTLPGDWAQKQPALSQLATELSTRFEVPAPRIDSSGPNPVPLQRVDENLFIGRSATSEFGQSMTIGQLLAQLHEFAPDSRLPIQAGVIGPILFTPNQDLVVFRVTAAQPAHAPASLAEVQAAVVQDATSSLRYAELVRRAPEVLQKAEKEGLAVLAKDYGTSIEQVPALSLANLMSVMRGVGVQPSPLSRAGTDADAVRTVLQRAVTLPMDTPLSAVPEAQRLLTVAVPSKQLLLVVRINEVRPVSLEDWAMVNSGGAIRHALSQGEPGPNMRDLFGLEQLRARYGFKKANPEGPDRAMPTDTPAF